VARSALARVVSTPLRRVLVGVLALVVAGLAWFALQVYPLGGQGRLVVVTVQPGDSIAAIAGEMHADGVIHSPLAFRIDTLLLGGLTIQPGSYGIRQNSSFAEVRAVFGAPPNMLVVVPGLTLHEIALRIEAIRGSVFASAFVADATAGAATNPYHPNGSLEGLVGVGTYFVSHRDTPSSLLDRLEKGFNREAASVGLSPTSTVEGLDAYQAVIAASIVEKEGYYPQNMPKVARVIFNRLARGGPLQMDSTVLYYFNQDGGTVTPAMLQAKTPYNTYLHDGLTPTPICVVSTSALEAVLHAPPGPWLYFTLVSKDGTEAFATTFTQQLANERIAAKRGIG
jgi:peptidoglycan lytic transglycosylase G